jgi:hypothetical protein
VPKRAAGGKRPQILAKRAVNMAPTVWWVPGAPIPEPKENGGKGLRFFATYFFRSLLG